MSKRNENNWIDLSSLPKMGGKGDRVAWTKIFDCEVDFCYENICGTLKIIKPLPNRKCLVSYNGKEMEVHNDTLHDCRLAYVVGIKTHDFKYQVGEMVNTKDGLIKILKQGYKHKSKKCGEKIYETNRRCYDFECQACHGVIYEYDEENIDKLIKCPFCSSYRLLVGFNDMWTTHPEQAKLLKNPEDGFKYMFTSNSKILEWVCPVCGEIIKKPPADVAYKGLCCPMCRNTTSYPNRFMYNFIKQLTSNVNREKQFDWSQGRKYDIYFDDKYICEAHGLQHYEEQPGFTARTLQEEQENDKLKQILALKNGIEEYIVIDCRKSDFEFIKKNVLNSKFSELYDLSKIDWIKLENDINNNIYIRAANLWNSGIYDPEILTKELDISKSNVCIIFGRAKELGLCDYNTEITQAIGREKVKQIRYQKYAKPILCNETCDCFGNLEICTSTLNNKGLKVERSNIQRNIRTGKRPVRGLTFKYITHEEFNKIKTEFPDKAYGDFFVA